MNIQDMLSQAVGQRASDLHLQLLFAAPRPRCEHAALLTWTSFNPTVRR